MKTHATMKLLAALTLGALPLQAAITIPGADGSDGVLNITANTEIDLSLAPTGVWDANNSANAGKGIYDAAKWAVVFKYSSVTVAAGATLTFKNHPSGAPVVWLVNGNVTIGGWVTLDGQHWQQAPKLAMAGPGGFRGGSAYFSPGVSASAGFGVGGGFKDGNYGYGASYGSFGFGGPSQYGNPSNVPLIGGSGGGGNDRFANEVARQFSGGGGGGAFLIACSGAVSLSGTVSCNGGWGRYEGSGGSNSYSGSGSGGAIRIVADTLSGTGQLHAFGGSGGHTGGLGRIRIERVTNSNTISVTPDPSPLDLAPGATALIWPPATAPEVRIVSIGGVNAPADPRAAFGTLGADVALPTTNTTTVIVETTNVELGSQVKVRMTPRSNANYTEVPASHVNEISPGVRRWTATFNATVTTGYSAVQARVVRP